MNSTDQAQPDSAILSIGNSEPVFSKPMICVSIGRGRHRMMIAEHRHLAASGAKLVELRLDYIRRPVNMSRLLDNRPCPVVATCRRSEEGGKWERSEHDRLGLLRTAIADGAEYVDLEHDIADQIQRYGDTKRIISYHNFQETPDNIEEIHSKLRKLDPDIIKIVTMANHATDNFRMLRLCQSDVPTVAFCMGEIGLASRILCGKFGAPFTFAAFNKDRQIAPGQLSFKQMVKDYRYGEISASTKVLGVVADPVKHSLSPRIHNAMIRDAKLDMVYLPFRVPAEQLAEFMEGCREFGVVGLSITIPHKENAIRCINVLDENVVGIRACNTVVFKGENALGYNTDCDAAMQSLKPQFNFDNPDKPFEGAEVLIMGAGGVARALAFGLKRGGANVYITARDYRKADQLATKLKCRSIDWAKRANHHCDVLINATPVGQTPNLNETPFDEEWFEKHMIVFDVVYNPEQTLFIKLARQAGCRTITGVDMFVQQAAAQFKLFTGREPNFSLARKEIKRATSPARI